MKKPNSNQSERINLTFNKKQIEIIKSLIGEMGDNKADVIKSVFTSWLSEKGITPAIVKKKLKL